MTDRIRGSFPGGPTRQDRGTQPGRAPRLRRVEDIEARVARRTLESGQRRRRTRLRVALMLALAGAFAAGIALGRSSHTTQAELTAADAAGRVRDADVSAQVNRMLLELWKMEDIEAARNRGRTR